MIKNIEFTRNRFNALQDLVIEGDDAEVVLKYANRLKDDIERETLEALKGNGDITVQRNYYKVACRFVEMLEHAVANGKRKEKTLAEIKGKG